MSVPPLRNDFNGGSNGVAISAGNSGPPSGNAFDTILGTTPPTYSSDNPFNGSLSLKVPGSSVDRTTVRWENFGGITIPVYFRFYLYLTAIPTGGAFWYFCSPEVTPGTASGFMWVDGNGHLGLDSQAGGMSGAVSTTVLPTNQWNRIEIKWVANGTVGSGEWRLYTDPFSDAITETKGGSGVNTGASLGGAWFGFGLAAAGLTGITGYIDDIAVSHVDWIGKGKTESLEVGMGH